MKNISWLLLMGLLVTAPVAAQDAPLVGAVPAVFLPGADRRTGEQVNSQLVTQIASFPVASSSGGFTFDIDAALGTVKPRSKGFGPTIGERARTIGRGQMNFGVGYQHVSFESYWGFGLEEGADATQLNYPGFYTFGGRNRGLISNNLDLGISGHSTVASLIVGVSNSVDVAVLVPFNQVTLDTRLTSTIAVDVDDPRNEGAPFVIPGEFPGSVARSDSAAGLGDIAVRAKWAPMQNTSGAIAGIVELRMPTGDRNKLLGLGTTQVKTMLSVETDAGAFSPHGSIGYTLSGDAWTSEGVTGSATRYGLPISFDLANEVSIAVPDELSYQAGVDVTAGRVSLGVDLTGRVLRDAGELVEQPRTVTLVNAAGVQQSRSLTVQRIESGNVHLSYLSVGAKFNVAGTVLIRVGSLFSLTENGLKAKPVPTVGVEYAF